MSTSKQQGPLDAIRLLERWQDWTAVEPDAEADQCSAAFESFARDRLDEWHATLAAWDEQGTDGLSSELLVSRDLAAITGYAALHPAGARTVELCERVTSAARDARAEDEASDLVGATRRALEPVFKRSLRWQSMDARLPEHVPTPWLVQLLLDVLITARASDGRPAPFAPWLALWARGVWPMPLGDGGMALWIPSSGVSGGVLTMGFSATATSMRSGAAEVAAGLFGPCRALNVFERDVVFAGPTRTSGLDSQPGVTLRLADAAPPPFNPAPRDQLRPPTVYGAPPPGESDSLFDRLRRWILGG